MRFSIIIPVYNVERYIRKCMESVMEQTFRDFEVIVVDDESPDNSMRIVEEFAEKYPGMITMIHQKNKRLGGARNTGAREARGDYLLFVDSDDYVSTDMLEVLDAQIKSHGCDMLVFNYCMVTPEGAPLFEAGLGALRPGMYFPRKDKELFSLPISAVNKVYRRALYQECGFQFPEKLLYEDAMTRFLTAKASSVYLHDAVLYYYVQSPGSIMRQKVSPHVLDILKVTDMVLSAFTEAGIYEDFRKELDASLLTGILHIFNQVNKADRESGMQDTFASYIREHFGEYENNPCILKENKAAIRCILSGNYTRYHFRFLKKLELMEAVMAFPPVAALNKLRKRILQKERG